MKQALKILRQVLWKQSIIVEDTKDIENLRANLQKGELTAILNKWEDFHLKKDH